MPEIRKLSAIIFADISGYTSLMQSDENKALQFIRQFKDTLERETLAHNGQVMQYYGDGCLLSFESSTQAVHCAVALQKGFRDGLEIPVRIGIHMGEVLYKEGNVYGDGVNVASRIESAGVPGSILISKSVRDQVKNKSDFPLVSLGAFSFKNVNEPIHVYALSTPDLVVPAPGDLTVTFNATDQTETSALRKYSWAVILLAFLLVIPAVYFGFFRPKAGTDNKNLSPSIAVLPLMNLSQDNQQDYLSEGFTSEIIYQLSKIDSLSIVSQSSVMELSSQNKTSIQIANELDVNYVLEGTIRSAGQRVRLTINLVRATDQQLIWAGEFDLNEEDLIDAQIKASIGIAEKLPLSLSAENRKLLTRKATSNPLAYEYYLKALDKIPYWVTPLESFDAPINYLQNAIKLDENYARAYALLGQLYYRSSNMVGANQDALIQKALAAAHKAIELDPVLPQGYLILGRIHNESTPPTGLKWLVKANELDPKVALFDLGSYYEKFGDWVTACEYYMLKIKRDPKSELGYIGMGRVYHEVGDFDSAIAIFEQLIDQGFEDDRIYGNLIILHLVRDQIKEALSVIETYIFPRDSLSGFREKAIVFFFDKQWSKAEQFYKKVNIAGDMDLGLIHMKTGRKKSGLTILEDAVQRRLNVKTNQPWPIRDLSRIYAAMGNRTMTYKYLEELLARDDLHYSWFDIDPFFDEIRHEPAFQKIAAKRAAKMLELRKKISTIDVKTQ
jgi:adenylate cyclase